jgi:hypothetical protein
MTKTLIIAALLAAPLTLGFKLWAEAVAMNDEHLLVVARCMNERARRLDISHQEAYIMCEKEMRNGR